MKTLTKPSRRWWSPQGETFVTTIYFLVLNIVLSKSTRVHKHCISRPLFPASFKTSNAIFDVSVHVLNPWLSQRVSVFSVSVQNFRELRFEPNKGVVLPAFRNEVMVFIVHSQDDMNTHCSEEGRGGPVTQLKRNLVNRFSMPGGKTRNW